MKYCTHCGKELVDEAVACPYCGCSTGRAPVYQHSYNNSSAYEAPKEEKETSTLSTCALVFAFLMPAIGFILGIVGTFKYTNLQYKKRSFYAIIISIVVRVFLS